MTKVSKRFFSPTTGLALLLATLAVGAPTLTACSSDEAAKKDSTDAPTQAQSKALDRRAFNQAAASLYVPLFWRADDNNPGIIDPDEVAVLWGYDAGWNAYVQDGKLSPTFDAAVANIQAVMEKGHSFSHLEASERARRELLLTELNQGRPTIVFNDFTAGSAEDKAIVTHIMKAARLIEDLHAKQIGSATASTQIEPNDTVSKAVLKRNQGPWCVAPKTEENADCNAVSEKPAKISGLYPAGIQADPKFCEMLAAREDQATLLDHFNVVVEGEDGTLTAVPYNTVYKTEMDAIAAELEAAAAAITDPSEEPFKNYLLADAQAFRINEWNAANEAWAKMNVHNSKWYLRLAPDEVYFEPCATKAGFHVSFARINTDSLKWQEKLEPVKSDMENALAALAGAPYTARDVSFHLPDFIDIIVNAGDARAPHGATIGQSLPNWGPVANEGRGRTVAMTNLYTDKDSALARKVQYESVFCPSVEPMLSYEPEIGTMSTVLHEAAHNLGPAHEYKVDGKTAREVFGGPLASTLEELKAQTSAMYFAEWLLEKGILDEETVKKAHVRDIGWMMGHISRGMYQANGKPKPYSQLAAIQFAYLTKAGAITFDPNQKPMNGTDTGCVAVVPEKMKAAIDALETTVLKIKGSGDKVGAEALVKEFVDDEGEYKSVRGILTERWLRTEKASFVYSVKL